jgi:hypothetical protein
MPVAAWAAVAAGATVVGLTAVGAVRHVVADDPVEVLSTEDINRILAEPDAELMPIPTLVARSPAGAREQGSVGGVADRQPSDPTTWEPSGGEPAATATDRQDTLEAAPATPRRQLGITDAASEVGTEPTPSSSVTSEPTVDPSVDPSVEPTVEPTADPSASGGTSPSPDGSPSGSPEPSASPSPSPTPSPTATPSPTPTGSASPTVTDPVASGSASPSSDPASSPPAGAGPTPPASVPPLNQP